MRNGIKTISNPALNPTGLTAVGLAPLQGLPHSLQAF
jgi:hypothetical protein